MLALQTIPRRFLVTYCTQFFTRHGELGPKRLNFKWRFYLYCLRNYGWNMPFWRPSTAKWYIMKRLVSKKRLRWAWKRKFGFIKRFDTKDWQPDIPSAQVSAERALGVSWFVNTGNFGFKVWFTALSLCHSFICPCTVITEKQENNYTWAGALSNPFRLYEESSRIRLRQWLYF